MKIISSIDWSGILDIILSVIIFSLPKILIFSFILFIGSIILLIFLNKAKLFKRQINFWNIILKLNYLYIPALFICLGIACGCISASKAYINLKHQEIINPISVTVVDGVVDLLSAEETIELMNAEGFEIQNFVNHIYEITTYVPKSNSLIERQKAYWSNEIAGEAITWGLTFAVRKTLANIAETLYLDLFFDEKMVTLDQKILKDIDFTKLDSSIPNLLTNMIHSKLQSLLRGLYAQFIFTFLIFLVIPFLEMVFYFKWYKLKYE